MSKYRIRPTEWLAMAALVLLVVVGSLAPAKSVSCERLGESAQCFPVNSGVDQTSGAVLAMADSVPQRDAR